MIKPAKLPHPVYGWDPVKLFQNLSVKNLLELRAVIERDPASKNPGHVNGSIYLYAPAARRKLDAIGWAITYHLQERRSA